MAVRMTEQMQTVGNIYRTLIPSEKGESLEEQIYPWNKDGIKQNMQEPIPLEELGPDTLSRIMQMMAVEAQHWNDYRSFSTWVEDQQMKSLLGQLARAEHAHHLKLMSFLPMPKTPSEEVLINETSLLVGYQMAIEHEPNEAVKSAFQHIFQDHLQHAEYADNLMKEKDLPRSTITAGCDFSGGRPLDQQFLRAEDTFWQGKFDGCYSKDTVDKETLLHVDKAMAGELAAWDGYHCAMTVTQTEEINLHWASFQSIEDQHLAILGSIRDPKESLLERALVHEQVETHYYEKFMDMEDNPRVKKVFQDLHREDMEQGWQLGKLAK